MSLSVVGKISWTESAVMVNSLEAGEGGSDFLLVLPVAPVSLLPLVAGLALAGSSAAVKTAGGESGSGTVQGRGPGSVAGPELSLSLVELRAELIRLMLADDLLRVSRVGVPTSMGSGDTFLSFFTFLSGFTTFIGDH